MDNSNEVRLFEWCNTFLEIYFEINKEDDGDYDDIGNAVAISGSGFILIKRLTANFSRLLKNGNQDIDHAFFLKTYLNLVGHMLILQWRVCYSTAPTNVRDAAKADYNCNSGFLSGQKLLAEDKTKNVILSLILCSDEPTLYISTKLVFLDAKNLLLF